MPLPMQRSQRVPYQDVSDIDGLSGFHFAATAGIIITSALGFLVAAFIVLRRGHVIQEYDEIRRAGAFGHYRKGGRYAEQRGC